MSEVEQAERAASRGRARATLMVAIAGLLLVIAAGLGTLFVFRFADAERDRDLRSWQARMGIVAESRLADINGWLEAQFSQLRALADNASLQLYMTQLALSAGDTEQITDEPAHLTYLRNLLVAEADRGGFTGPVLGPEVGANVRRLGVAGLGLLDMERRMVVATPSMPPVDQRLERALAGTPRGERTLIDIYLGVADTPTMGFIAPVFALQAEQAASTQIGWVVGIKEVADELYPRLHQPGATEETGETLLVRSTENTVEYLSPLMDGTEPLKRSLSLSTEGLAAVFALETPGGFEIKRDYRDSEVLVTARAVAYAPWALIYKIDTAEALADTDARRSRLTTVFLLIIGVISVALIAVWRQASGRRAGEAAARYRELAERFESQQKFLRLVTDSQPSAIMILDEESRLHFANLKAARDAGIDAKDMIGKTLASVIGPALAKPLESVNREVFVKNESAVHVHRSEEGETAKVFQTEHIPLPATAERPRGVLVVSEDITAAVTEREKSERIMRELVDTLVSVVDRRDPFSAHHSTRVAQVARAIAKEISLDPVGVQTAEIAAELMNLGKILVPEELLKSERKLSREERMLIRNSILTSAELLEGVEFEGPVVETLRQMEEFWDGSGMPRGIEGKEILQTARIVAVANAFVGLVSVRAYRDGLGFEKAIDILLADSGKQFDRAVVAALIHHVENQGGREDWAHFGEKPAGA